jgi:hypothetical protein
MKHLSTSILLAVIFGSSLAAAEPSKGKAAREGAFSAVPDFDYWDANAWETGSGASFWHEPVTGTVPATQVEEGKKAGKAAKQKKKSQTRGN